MGVAIVTGAARGIGAAAAHALFAEGHDVVVVDRCRDDPRLDYGLGTEAELAQVARDCDAPMVIGDVVDPATSQEAVAAATERFGGVDIAVAAAGVMAGTVSAWTVPDGAWQAMFDTNVTGTMQLARAVIPAMLAQPHPRQGRFIGLSSAIALKATPQLAGYAASKAAVLSFVRSMAADLTDSGITANLVQPGATSTALLERSASIYDLTHSHEFSQHHLNLRLIEPHEIAAAIAWLCSSHASAITGAVLPVDGGMTAR